MRGDEPRALTKDMVFARTKCNRLDLIRNLNLWGNNLDDIGILQLMPNLEVLSLSVNNVSSLEPLRKCVKLTELYLRKNEVEDLSEVQNLAGLPCLRVLWLHDNPCSNLQHYRLYVLHHLSSLVKLDSQDITDEERRMAQKFDIRDAQSLGNRNHPDNGRASPPPYAARGSPAGFDGRDSPQSDQSRGNSACFDDWRRPLPEMNRENSWSDDWRPPAERNREHYFPDDRRAPQPADAYREHSFHDDRRGSPRDRRRNSPQHQAEFSRGSSAQCEGFRVVEGPDEESVPCSPTAASSRRNARRSAAPPERDVADWCQPRGSAAAQYDTGGDLTPEDASIHADYTAVAPRRRLDRASDRASPALPNNIPAAASGKHCSNSVETSQKRRVRRSMPNYPAEDVGPNQTDNILLAVLALVKELDAQGLELVRRAIDQRQSEI